MARLLVASVLAGGFVLSACAALGPKANVSVIKAEVKETKDIANIIIPDVTGIDATGNTGKALLGTAMKAYGTRARPVAAANAILSTLGAPDGLASILTASF